MKSTEIEMMNAVCDAFGIAERNIVSMSLDLKVGEVPRLQIVRHVLNADKSQFVRAIQQFDIVERKPK
jgi:hypothetical protein